MCYTMLLEIRFKGKLDAPNPTSPRRPGVKIPYTMLLCWSAHGNCSQVSKFFYGLKIGPLLRKLASGQNVRDRSLFMIFVLTILQNVQLNGSVTMVGIIHMSLLIKLQHSDLLVSITCIRDHSLITTWGS